MKTLLWLILAVLLFMVSGVVGLAVLVGATICWLFVSGVLRLINAMSESAKKERRFG